MDAVVFTLETVTPLFLGGASRQPELRPASVRGLLRCWFRAAMGGVIGDSDLPGLHRLEAEVFGDTEGCSPIVVRLVEQRTAHAKADLLPHKLRGETDAFPAGTTFDLKLSLRRGCRSDALEIAAWSALLWITLGGMGRRSRRGAGDLRVSALGALPDSFPQALRDCLEAAARAAPDADALAADLAALLDCARQAFQDFAQQRLELPSPPAPRFSHALPTFSVLQRDTRIVAWTPDAASTDCKDALVRLMKTMSKCKADLGWDFDEAFGGISPRRSSPLWATVHRVGTGWTILFTYLKAQIEPGREGKPHLVTAFLDGLSPRLEISPRPQPSGGES